MESIRCEQCLSNEFEEKQGELICSYCGTRYAKNSDKASDATIGLADDISNLLRKCKNDPTNARRYANLILDIDPSNRDALRYL